jgi:hypothetical protein
MHRASTLGYDSGIDIGKTGRNKHRKHFEALAGTLATTMVIRRDVLTPRPNILYRYVVMMTRLRELYCIQ